jgi:hypothetical protein
LKTVSADLDYPELDKVIQRACEKRREDRYPDMTAFASALAQATPTQMTRPMSSLMNQVSRGSGTAGDEAIQETLVRAESLLATPKPQEMTLPGRDPSVLIVPKSNAPYVVLGLVVLALAGGGIYFMRDQLLQGRAEVVEVKKVPPPPVDERGVDPPPPVPPTPPPNVDVANERDTERGRDYLARGKNAWERGALEEAYQFFKDVPEKTEFKPEAITFMARIDTVREKLRAAQAAQHRGACEDAIPLFNAVLKLNGKVSDASGGLRACQAAALPGTLE